MVSGDPHPDSEGVGYSGAVELAREMAAGRLSSVEVTRALLGRIAAIDAPGQIGLRAVLAISGDALDVAAARDAEVAAGRVLGPLHGVPVLVKDNIEAIGLPATAGSLALAARPPQRDAPIVAALRSAGAVVLGATNLSEWANIRSSRSTSGWSAVGGLTANPWALDRSAGGSSSGSGAALAAGYAPLAIGTETDGSIMCPSSLNGIVGLKPTVGRLPTAGIVPISASQDAPGPMARTVRDAALLMDALSGVHEHERACGSLALRDARIGVADGWRSDHDRVERRFDEIVAELGKEGATIVRAEVTDPGRVRGDELHVLLAELCDDLTAYLAGRGGSGPASLAAVVEFNRAHADQELVHFGQELFETALTSGGRAAETYEPARRRCIEWAIDANLGRVLGNDVEFVIAPAYAPAWKSDFALGDNHAAGGRSMSAPSMAGWPILGLPMGIVDGLPVGMVVIGAPNTEARLFALGHAIEAMLGLELRPGWLPPTRG